MSNSLTCAGVGKITSISELAKKLNISLFTKTGIPKASRTLCEEINKLKDSLPIEKFVGEPFFDAAKNQTLISVRHQYFATDAIRAAAKVLQVETQSEPFQENNTTYTNVKWKSFAATTKEPLANLQTSTAVAQPTLPTTAISLVAPPVKAAGPTQTAVAVASDMKTKQTIVPKIAKTISTAATQSTATATAAQNAPKNATTLQSLENTVEPCKIGSVNRCCLTRQAMCGNYVVQSVDEIYGKPVKKLGEGTYGAVHLTDKNFAIKCFKIDKGKFENYGELRSSDLNEIVVLRNLIHPNIVSILQVAINDESITDCNTAMVMPLGSTTMKHIPNLDKDTKERAYYMYQLLRGVEFMHSRGVIHRDIKPENVLWYKDERRIALADFGLAMGQVTRSKMYTKNAFTIWYRPPEVFTSPVVKYNYPADVWGVGACWLKMLKWTALEGDGTEIDQVLRIFSVSGFPSQSLWPEGIKLNNLPFDSQSKITYENGINMRHSLVDKRGVSVEEFELVSGLLSLDPKQRTTASNALSNPWFNDVRDVVVRNIPARTLPRNLDCMEPLLAMELSPLGDYAATFMSPKNQKFIRMVFPMLFDFFNQFNQYVRFPACLNALTILHRFFAASKIDVDKNLDNFNKFMFACVTIATMLDADLKSPLYAFQVDTIFENSPYSEKDIVTQQNEIYTLLDLDLDRPFASTFFLKFVEGMAEKDYQRATTTLESYFKNYDKTVKFRGSQLAFKALESNKIVTNCMSNYRKQFPELFSKEALQLL